MLETPRPRPEQNEISDAEVSKLFDDALIKENAPEAASAECSPERKSAELGQVAERFAEQAVGILKGKGSKADLIGFKDRFLAAAREQDPSGNDRAALKALDRQLAGLHEAYFGLDQKELASEIDSFKRSLETSTEIKTGAGRDFLADLNSDAFPTIETAITALEKVKEAVGSSGKQEDMDALNAEFNVLFAATQDKFQSKTGQKLAEGEASFAGTDDDLDAAFDNLEMK